MIDWYASDYTIETVKNKNKVIVVCEKCNTKRDQLYQVAKKKTSHICMSCAKSQNKHGDFKTGQLVTHKCACGVEKDLKYRPQRYNNWKCHHCAMVEGHKAGKFRIVNNTPSAEGIARISVAAKKRWADPEYRASMSKQKVASKDDRSEVSKKIWSDEERLKKLSETIKSVWLDENYRNIRTKQSIENWNSEDYRRKHMEGMLKDDARQKMSDARLSQLGQTSSIQKALYAYLNDLGIEFYEESEKTKIGYYTFDCLIPKENGGLLIECQGDYWHTLARTQANDRAKFTYIEKYHPEYDIMYIWEHEFYAKDKVLGRLKSRLGIELQVEDFNLRDIKITDNVKAADINSFLNAYHYIGKGRSGKTFGAYLNNILIACVVYSGLIRQNIGQQFEGDSVELARLCVHPSYQKKNLASYFLSRTFKFLNVNNVISYCDTTVGHTGAVYKSLGFKLHHEVEPDYWYVDTNGWAMHKKTLYERAKKSRLLESEYANKFGYIKKFGGKKYCFIKEL